MLEGRRAEVLRALVEEHIRTGQPVSSRAILERSRLDVSPATVRNDLAALESEGYAVQPHTSAGRVPTAAAYRYYVDHLRPSHIRGAAQEKIASFFGEVQLELSKLLKATSDLLAEITDLPSVVVAPGVAHDRVRVLHAVQLSSDQILVIVVTEGGRVIQQRGRLGAPVTPLEVEQAQELVAGVAVGKELGRVAVSDDALDDASEPVREAIRPSTTVSTRRRPRVARCSWAEPAVWRLLGRTSPRSSGCWRSWRGKRRCSSFWPRRQGRTFVWVLNW